MKHPWNIPNSGSDLGIAGDIHQLDAHPSTMETMTPTCTADDCERPPKAFGVCPRHYQRLRRNGHLEAVRQAVTPEEQARKHAARQAAYKARKAAQPTLPFGPLAEWILVEYDREPSIRNVAELCEVGRRIAHRWHRTLKLTVDEADRAAIKLGYHPCEIWPEWLEVA